MKKILIIDDDLPFIASIKATLDPTEYTVQAAGNGAEGLKRIEESIPDLILLDMMMPVMDGITFLKEMNMKYGERKIPVIVTSNVSTIDKISEGVSLGVHGYFIKSDESLESIVGIINDAFKNKK